MVFYGTGAAEGIPNPFCNCSVCINARNMKGKEIRRRSMFRLNMECCIDLGADSFCQAIEYGDFIHLLHVLITHTHEDHFAHMMLNVRNMAITRLNEPLNFYLTDKAYDMVDFMVNSKPIMKGLTSNFIKDGIIAFWRLGFGKTVEIAGMEVTPLKGNHYGNMGENSANYLIRMIDGKVLYYGLDTGYYLEETFQALKNVSLDYLISECTFGLTTGRGETPGGHLDAFSCIKVFRRLYEQNTITENTSIYLTHINHYNGTHKELDDYFRKQDLPFVVTVAYDGMKIIK